MSSLPMSGCTSAVFALLTAARDCAQQHLNKQSADGLASGGCCLSGSLQHVSWVQKKGKDPQWRHSMCVEASRAEYHGDSSAIINILI